LEFFWKTLTKLVEFKVLRKSKYYQIICQKMTKTLPNQKNCLSTFYSFPISFLHHGNAKMSTGNIMLQFPFLLEKVGQVFNKKNLQKSLTTF
jgi:hypothetical protein